MHRSPPTPRCTNSGRCDVTLERNSGVALYPDIGKKVVCKMALATLNLLLVEYGLATIETLPDALAAHFALQFSSRHDAVAAYIAQLDPAVLAFPEQARERHAFSLDRLRIYQYFAGAQGTFRRNRLQAVHALPWLLACLSEAPISPNAVSATHACPADEGAVARIARAKALLCWTPFRAVCACLVKPNAVDRQRRREFDLPRIPYGAAL